MSECVVRMPHVNEMPESCLKCNVNLGICDKRLLWKDGENSRHPDCPIIAVLPENHGRLVDADEISKYWKCRIALMNSCSGKRGILESVEASTLKSCIEDIGSAKDIVPAERR